ncbi:EF-hand domain-containing protein [Hyphobacterium marinum]|uniref:EF-hand domain-containing protein n=1 Tax=Hyphobacterium marinum TaxID=3116574 RepID=A0ABU7LVR1_9PROT|nr:EF-hand domain-containing protein [Hyphobacterium sp. Y6023]MEE2565649.1 EF-hand domain-containing protein [Hyphobacterium sp. Y6023]
MTRKPTPPEPKKTEALEVRVSAEQKADFMAACDARGRPASHVIREAMRRYAQWGTTRRAHWRMTMLGMLTIAVTAGSVMTLNPSDADGAGARLYGAERFRAYDQDHDRRLTLTELLGTVDTVRTILAQRDERPGDAGSVLGVLFARYPSANAMETEILHADPDAVSPACWTALEAAWVDDFRSRFQNWDSDSDGVVTAREFSDADVRRLRAAFAGFDRNGDGVLTELDYTLPAPPYSGAPPVQDTPVHLQVCEQDMPHRTPVPVNAAVQVSSPEQAAAMIRFADSDGDAQVSFEEYLALGF